MVMPIYSEKNPYRGINAHLNSFIQNTSGEWESFHAAHIADMARALDRHLPQGYFARLERSLQITEAYGEWERRPRPDVTIFSRPQTAPAPSERVATAARITPLLDTVDRPEDEYLTAVVIYKGGEGGTVLGKPVTRLELLSPTNKPPGEGFIAYRAKRDHTLMSGLPLIEIDYLHQSRPVIHRLPSYPDGEPNAAPYTVVVSDPRPILHEGKAYIYAFLVGEDLPRIEIPLKDEETCIFDLGEVYEETLSNSRFYQQAVDYAELPLQFETYAPADQTAIQGVMAALKTSSQNA